MDPLVILSLIFSISSVLISISAILVNNYRNVIQRSSFNIARFKGTTNETYWIRVIKAFIHNNVDHLENIENFNYKDEKDIETVAVLKYHHLLQMAMGGELKRETVIKCLEIVFVDSLKDSYWENKTGDEILDLLYTKK